MESIDTKQFAAAVLCPICNGNSLIIDMVKTINPNSVNTFNLRKCVTCRHWWIDPIPNQEYLSHLYANSSEFVVPRGYDEESSEVDGKRLQEYTSQIFDFISQHDKFNYLEVGVGSGHLFNYFRSKANLCYGIEPGCWRPSNPNIVSDIKDIPKDVRFDVIVLQDVLEHLADPIDMLLQLKSMANKGCLITCGFPNCSSLRALIFRGNWRMVRPIGHLHFFSSKSVVSAFGKTGWTIITRNSCRPGRISAWDTINEFIWKQFKNPLRGSYKLFKLSVGEIIMGKDQWYIQARSV
ncbi:MAG: class I SAM-dependent methyltransferase [Chloroflexi bacterium]|nr:class I SAM-dependent methyltransferase [Chloroflexota bacterium]